MLEDLAGIFGSRDNLRGSFSGPFCLLVHKVPNQRIPHPHSIHTIKYATRIDLLLRHGLLRTFNRVVVWVKHRPDYVCSLSYRHEVMSDWSRVVNGLS